MSLLLKALKQAETAKAAAAPEPAAFALEFDAPPPQSTPRPREWVEPPNQLVGGSAERRPAPPHATLASRVGLVPLAAAVAATIAVGYGVYLYFALRPAPLPAPPPAPVYPAEAAAPTVERAPLADAAAFVDAAVLDAPAPSSPPVAALEAAAPLTQAARARPAPGEARVPAPRVAAPAVFQPDTPAALLDQAYAAYQHGALDEARQLYTKAATRARSADALLGLATIAALQNRDAEAAALYREVLDVDPHNAVAQAALIDFLAAPDPAAAESRLKALIAREPSAQLYQSLGHLYAEQGRWNDAQAAYFEAYARAPDRPDYAYNLAVGLDRLRQPAAALTYYEKALAAPGAARFDRARAEARIAQLKPLVSRSDGTP